MSVRAVAFAKTSELGTDIVTFRKKFTDTLCGFGAAGFKTWEMSIGFLNRERSGGTRILLLRFSDIENLCISTSKEFTIVGDECLGEVYGDLGFTKRSQYFRVEGLSAYLGDIKVRYGIGYTMERPTGMLFDLEYFSGTSLFFDYGPLFDEIRDGLGLEVEFHYPKTISSNIFNLCDLGQVYQAMIESCIDGRV